MVEQGPQIQDAEIIPGVKGTRRSDGGIYVVVADETPEFMAALRYAVRMAEANRGHVCILHVIRMDDVPQWNMVESRMRRELRTEGEKFVAGLARRVNEINGTIPAIWIYEGEYHDALVDAVNGNEGVRMLILGGGTGADGPGALVGYFTGRGLGRLNVPVLVVPGDLENVEIDAIFTR